MVVQSWCAKRALDGGESGGDAVAMFGQDARDARMASGALGLRANGKRKHQQVWFCCCTAAVSAAAAVRRGTAGR